MSERRGAVLAELTTLRIGGPAARLVEATGTDEVVEAVRSADAAGEPVLLLGGGSNVVIGEAGWPGVVVLLRSRGVQVHPAGAVRSAGSVGGLRSAGSAGALRSAAGGVRSAGSAGAGGDGRFAAGAGEMRSAGPDRSAGPAGDAATVELTVQAGEPWDEVVATAVGQGWAGFECLAGIPGLAGATPVQNVGAYGQEVAGTVRQVLVLDRQRGRIRELPAADCAFGYRDSLFKRSDRYVVLAVTFRLRVDALSEPVRYAELADTLGVATGARARLADVRDAVLTLRRRKGMVTDAADHDTWSVGSFFTNPVLDPGEVAAFEARLEPGGGYPSWPDGARTKLSAAWLIEHAGFRRGFTGAGGRVALSTKHTLALTNRGGASAAEVIALARQVRDGVHDRFGVGLTPEPRLVGVTLEGADRIGGDQIRCASPG